MKGGQSLVRLFEFQVAFLDCLSDADHTATQRWRSVKHYVGGLLSMEVTVDNDDKRKAGQIGGARRAELLPAKRRAEIARQAAEMRWGGRPERASHKGNFEEEFGIDVDCYVLDDARKTAVISQRGMGEALGLSSRGNAFPRFLATKGMSEIAGAELRAKIENPLKFQWGTGGAEQPPATIHGFDVTLLIDLCNAIIAAESEGSLSSFIG